LIVIVIYFTHGPVGFAQEFEFTTSGVQLCGNQTNFLSEHYG